MATTIEPEIDMMSKSAQMHDQIRHLTFLVNLRIRFYDLCEQGRPWEADIMINDWRPLTSKIVAASVTLDWLRQSP